MSRRLVFLALGAAVGVLAVLRAGKFAAAEDGPQGASGGFGEQVREFMEEVRIAMAEREQELRTALGLDGTHDAVDADL